MSKITAEMWEKAIKRMNLVYECSVMVEDTFTVSLIIRLRNRYDDGERSIELHNAIMELC